MRYARFFVVLVFLMATSSAFSQAFSKAEQAAWTAQAARISIIRDNWGVPHVYTKTDADAVFGMMYVQCEEYFYKVESAIIGRMGRESEVAGKSAIYKDLWSRLYIDTVKAQKLYLQCNPYLKKLCDAYAAGINYFILTHPELKPQLLNRIKPWVPLMNNIPSIAGSNITDAELRKMYPSVDNQALAVNEFNDKEDKQAGSNGWAIAATKTKNKSPLLLINPHSEFYNRIEVQLVSEEGLNVYGAPFLGEFHIWQGFNAFCGWMHTVTVSDAKDLYAEKIKLTDGHYTYQYDNRWLPVDSNKVVIYFKNGTTKDSAKFTTYKTHHGPVVAKRDQQWLSEKSISENIELLSVHWNITKSKTYKEFVSYLNKRVMTGTNTIYADKTGNIAYWHGNFVPVRKSGYDWSRPVPGDLTETEWKGAHALTDIPNYINPKNGWVQNCNSTPLYGTGKFDSAMSLKPWYMLPDGHTPRAMNAVRMLAGIKDATIDTIIRMANDTYLMNAKRFIPALVTAYQTAAMPDSVKRLLSEPVRILQDWNYRTDTNSIATSLAVLWTEKILQQNMAKLKLPLSNEEQYAVVNGSLISLEGITNEKLVQTLGSVIADLQKDWGNWQVKWGAINRYQRVAANKEANDKEPSLAVAATPGFMGSLNAYVSKKTKDSKKRYGISGNTFVAVVSFGNKLTAKSILTGGANSDPASPHFTDQAKGYFNQDYKTVYFYKADLLQHVGVTYHPGEKVSY